MTVDCSGDGDDDVLNYPTAAERHKKGANSRQQKFFVLTSTEAYNAKKKYYEDKLLREKEMAERKRERAVKAEKRQTDKVEKAVAAAKRKLEGCARKQPRSKFAKQNKIECVSMHSVDGSISNIAAGENDLHAVGEPAVDDDIEGSVLENDLYAVGNFVIVDFEGDLYPGKVIDIGDDGLNVSVLHKSGLNWRWPKAVDAIHYSRSEIKKKISEPLPGRRGIFCVPELNAA